MKKALILLPLLLGAACLDFAEQTVTYQYHVKSDTFLIVQDYRGIHGADDAHILTEKELKQLGSVLRGQRTFFFSNWIFEYDAETVRKAIEKETDDPHEKRLQVWLRRLQDRVKVENGPFYKDTEGRLCGIQRVTIRDFRRLLEEGNRLARAFILDGRMDEDFDGPTLRLAHARAKAGHDFLTVQGNQLRLEIPVSAKEFQESFHDDDEPAAPYIKQLGGTLRHKDNLMTLSFGKPGDKRVRLNLKLPGKTYRPNAIGPVRAQNKILPKLDPAKYARQHLDKAVQKLTSPR